MDTTFSIRGTLVGELWWPTGAPAYKAASFTFSRVQDRPFVEHCDTIRQAVESLMRREDGDFSTAARLSADSYLAITHRTARRETTRYFGLDRFASIADYLTDDFAPGEEWES
jgi:hypothetical protein